MSREGYTGEFNSGGDTRAKLTVTLFPDGRGVIGGQFKTNSSHTGDRIHFNLGLKNTEGTKEERKTKRIEGEKARKRG